MKHSQNVNFIGKLFGNERVPLDRAAEFILVRSQNPTNVHSFDM